MDRETRGNLYAFYEKELKENILGFWLPRCIDKEYGGYLNCFDNRGEHLVSYECFILGKHTARNGVAGISPPRREFQKC